MIIGCDFHPSFQQIAYVDQETGEYGERRLSHREEVVAFYRSLAGRGGVKGQDERQEAAPWTPPRPQQENPCQQSLDRADEVIHGSCEWRLKVTPRGMEKDPLKAFLNRRRDVDAPVQ